MTFKHILIASSFLALTACASGINVSGGHYWERTNMSDATYLRGEKAQRALNDDIARCVVDMREVERAEMIKNAIPSDPGSEGLDPDRKTLADWETPDHDGALLAEHSDYHDFEGCMLDKGWSRVDNMPYNVAEQGVVNYYKANVNYGYDPRVASSRKKPAPKPEFNQ